MYADGTPLFAKNWKDDKFVIDSNLYWDAAEKNPAFPGGTFADWQRRGHDAHSLVADLRQEQSGSPGSVVAQLHQALLAQPYWCAIIHQRRLTL